MLQMSGRHKRGLTMTRGSRTRSNKNPGRGRIPNQDDLTEEPCNLEPPLLQQLPASTPHANASPSTTTGSSTDARQTPTASSTTIAKTSPTSLIRKFSRTGFSLLAMNSSMTPRSDIHALKRSLSLISSISRMTLTMATGKMCAFRTIGP